MRRESCDATQRHQEHTLKEGRKEGSVIRKILETIRDATPRTSTSENSKAAASDASWSKASHTTGFLHKAFAQRPCNEHPKGRGNRVGRGKSVLYFTPFKERKKSCVTIRPLCPLTRKNLRHNR